MKITSQLAFAVVLGLLTGSCYASEEALKRLIPVDAKSVAFDKVGAAKQVSYVVVREYPSSGLQREALGAFRKEGWTYCGMKGEEWSSFLDATGAERQRIYQRLSYLKKGEHLITIGERYYANSAAQLRPGNPGGPDDKSQQVVIVEGKPGSKQIDELLQSSRAICEGSQK